MHRSPIISNNLVEIPVEDLHFYGVIGNSTLDLESIAHSLRPLIETGIPIAEPADRRWFLGSFSRSPLLDLTFSQDNPSRQIGVMACAYSTEPSQPLLARILSTAGIQRITPDIAFIEDLQEYASMMHSTYKTLEIAALGALKDKRKLFSAAIYANFLNRYTHTDKHEIERMIQAALT